MLLKVPLSQGFHSGSVLNNEEVKMAYSLSFSHSGMFKTVSRITVVALLIMVTQALSLQVLARILVRPG